MVQNCTVQYSLHYIHTSLQDCTDCTGGGLHAWCGLFDVVYKWGNKLAFIVCANVYQFLSDFRLCFSIEQAHEQQVRDIDFNPNKIYHFATCGDDCQVNYWDSRKTKEPLMIRRDHSHW